MSYFKSCDLKAKATRENVSGAQLKAHWTESSRARRRKFTFQQLTARETQQHSMDQDKEGQELRAESGKFLLDPLQARPGIPN